MDIIAGTAGHIDHGKTALVKALTGTDADRLPEEKQRGITIDLGFAELDLGDVRIGFVDVPGHERFVKNMLAGVGGIDLVMLVIAADEGVMPQTREHFQICRLLETRAGMVAITKSDLADEELIELVRLEVAELVAGSFLERAPVVAVSSKTGEGIEEIKQALIGISASLPAREDEQVRRLPIDRSFTVKGFGAVVTGTLLAGEITEGDELEIMPAGRAVRVRGVQAHRKAVKTVHAGQRAAVNLGGIDHTEIERGMVLCEKGVLRPTQAFDAEIEVLKDSKKALRSRQRVRVHIGTVEALARVQVLEDGGEIEPGGRGLAQLRLETAVIALPGDTFIIRSYSPQATIAGGRILDAFAKRHRGRETAAARAFLAELIKWRVKPPDFIGNFLDRNGEGGATFAELQALTGWTDDRLRSALCAAMVYELVVFTGDNFIHFISHTHFAGLSRKTLAEIEAHHKREPLAKGILLETLREKIFRHVHLDIFIEVLSSLEKKGTIVREKGHVRLAAHNIEISEEEKLVLERLRKLYAEAKLEAPKLEDALELATAGIGLKSGHGRKIFQLLLNSGELVKITEDFYFSRPEIESLVEKVKAFAEGTADRLIDVPKFKEIAGISRKYAIPLLEYFDRERVTRRAGDKRLVSG
jgi:selenocysteine-specific elongation factor